MNKWKSQRSINYHVNYSAPLASTAGALFTPNTYFHIFFRYLKTVALIILNKTENHEEDLCLKIYALILAILICYFNLQHLKKHKILDQAQNQLCTAERDCVKDQTNQHLHAEKRMFCKVLCHVFVPSSGLDENNIKGAFYPKPFLILFPSLSYSRAHPISRTSVSHLLVSYATYDMRHILLLILIIFIYT